MKGQLSQLDRKSVEPIALAANVAARTLQQFLNSLEWNQDQLIDTLQHRVARDHASDRSIGLIDATSCPKKGEKTPGGVSAQQVHVDGGDTLIAPSPGFRDDKRRKQYPDGIPAGQD